MTDIRSLPYQVSLLGTLEKELRNLMGLRTLISELIQNADDAPGAIEMQFVVGTDAVEVTNDGQFRDVDFDRLREIASGGKRQEENTTGAFGIGFIAVYQITDHPEVESVGRHWTFFPERPGIDERSVPARPGTRFLFPWANDGK